MKKNLKLSGTAMYIVLAVLFLQMAAIGCKKEPLPEEVQNTLTVDMTEVQVKPEGETVRVPVETNAPLAAPISSHDWLKAEISEAESVLVLTAEMNTTGESRTATVSLKTAATKGEQAKAKVTVVQSAVDVSELFKFANEEYSLNFAAGASQVSLISEGSWELAQELPGWLEITPTSGEGDASLTVKYKSNVSIAERPTEIMFRNSGLGASAVLHLLQAGNPNGLNDFSHLGKGYDITGMYAHDSDAKASVLDCQKLYEEGHIADPLRPNQTEERIITGKTREEYTENYTMSATLKTNVSSWFKLGFKASVAANFSENSLKCSDNSYATFRHMTKKLIIKTHTNLEPADLMSCLSDEFINDAKNLSAEKLIKKYGTHVIMGLSLGGVLDYNMTADLTNQETEVNLGFAAQGGFTAGTGVKVQTDASINMTAYNKVNTASSFMETKLLCRGGESQFTSTGMNNSNDTYPLWLESLKDQTKWVMIDYEGNMLVPLEQFIADPAKSEAVKDMVEYYVTNTRFPDQVSKYGTLNITWNKGFSQHKTVKEWENMQKGDQVYAPESQWTHEIDAKLVVNSEEKPFIGYGEVFNWSYDAGAEELFVPVNKTLEKGIKINTTVKNEVSFIVNEAKTIAESLSYDYDDQVYILPADRLTFMNWQLEYVREKNVWKNPVDGNEYKDGDILKTVSDQGVENTCTLHWTLYQ